MDRDSSTLSGHDHLVVKHPTYKEHQLYREARVLRAMSVFLELNDAEIDDDTTQKLCKTINTRMLNIMNRTHDAAP